MKTKKVRPVLVESKLAINTIKNKNINLHYINSYLVKYNPSMFYHDVYQLILISLEDEKIEVGNKFWYRNYKLMTCTGLSKSGQILTSNEVAKHDDYGLPQSLCKKVIATQNQLSPELIQQLIDEYNNNGTIKDFEIEMEDPFINWEHTPILPKLTNGFVTVVKKESDNKEIGKPLEDYIRSKHTQEECVGFIDGYNARRNEESVLYTEEENLEYCLKALEMGFDLNNNPLPRLNEKSGKQYFMDWYQKNKKK